LSWDSTKYVLEKKSSNCCTFKFNRLLLNEWILHDIIFPRESNTSGNQTLNTFFFFLNGEHWNFFCIWLCVPRKSCVANLPKLSCSIFPTLSWPWRILGKIYSFVLWVCLLSSWTYLKLPLSAKVHSQSCCLNLHSRRRNTFTKLARVRYTLFR
jgi:hypothetical protein